MLLLGKTEKSPCLCGWNKSGSVVVSRQVTHVHESLGVVLRGLRRFQCVAGKVVVDRGEAGGHRMAPGDALYPGQAGEGQEVGERLHADVGVEKHVEALLGDQPAGWLQGCWQWHYFIGGSRGCRQPVDPRDRETERGSRGTLAARDCESTRG